MSKTLLKQYTKTQIAKALEFDRKSYYAKGLTDKKDEKIAQEILKIYSGEGDSLCHRIW